jgi:hypothetical protein
MLAEERAFEEALMQRGFEESSPGLSDRIISEALNEDPAGQKSILKSIRDIFSASPIPSPAIALPLLLVVGIAAGYLYPADSALSEPEGVQVAELIYYDEGFYE